MKRFKNTLAAVMLSVITCVSGLYSAQASAEDQFISLPSFRVGPYGQNGQAFYSGFIDYLTYINIKDGGVNGVKFASEGSTVAGQVGRAGPSCDA